MARLEPLRREDLPEYEATFRAVEAALGVLPNSTLTMARHPRLMKAFAALNAVVMADGRVDGVLKQLIATVVSAAAGCSYCQAHTSHVAERRGSEADKLDQVWDFENSPLFSDAERAALRVARGAGVTPNAVTDEDMDRLGDISTTSRSWRSSPSSPTSASSTGGTTPWRPSWSAPRSPGRGSISASMAGSRASTRPDGSCASAPSPAPPGSPGSPGTGATPAFASAGADGTSDAPSADCCPTGEALATEPGPTRWTARRAASGRR
jgi:AhpD family alkylhydroperoxidase